MKLLSGAANGNGSSFDMPHPGSVHKSHIRTLYVWGTFGGSTVKLQIATSDSPTEWFDVTDADNITSKTAINVEVRADHVRGVVSGGTGESINMFLR